MPRACLGGGLIQWKTHEAAEAVLAPKVAGARALASVLADDPPDFLLLFSSISVHTGGIGQVDYCAANAFLGALAARRGAIRTIAMDWCEWRMPGPPPRSSIPRCARSSSGSGWSMG